MRKKFLMLTLTKHKILNLHQQDSGEYFPLAWQMLTLRLPSMETVEVVEVAVEAVVAAVVTVEEGETDPLVELVVVEVGGEEETD